MNIWTSEMDHIIIVLLQTTSKAVPFLPIFVNNIAVLNGRRLKKDKRNMTFVDSSTYLHSTQSLRLPTYYQAA